MARKARRSAKQKAASRKNIKKAQAATRRRSGKRKQYKRKTMLISAHKRNPKKRSKRKTMRLSAHKRKSYRRRNPALSVEGYKDGITSLPIVLPKLLKGKSMIKNVGYASAGVVTGLIGGSFLQRYTLPLIEKLPLIGGNLSGGMIQRVLGAAFAYTATYGAGTVALKNDRDRTAFIAGGAAGAVIEAIFPGRLGAQLAKLPVVGPYIGYSSPVMGLAAYYGSSDLAAYVEAPAYQGVGAYVEAPAYQGVGAYVEAPAYQGVGEYVEAPGYQAESSAGDTVLAGTNMDSAGIGSNMASFLDSAVV